MMPGADQEETPGMKLMAQLEGMAEGISFFDSIKKQFVDRGWDERTAERMVIEILRAQTADRNPVD